MKCPHCGAELVVNTLPLDRHERCFFGGEHRVKDLFGREIAWRIGNCSQCSGIVDLVNGEVATVNEEGERLGGDMEIRMSNDTKVRIGDAFPTCIDIELKDGLLMAQTFPRSLAHDRWPGFVEVRLKKGQLAVFVFRHRDTKVPEWWQDAKVIWQSEEVYHDNAMTGAVEKFEKGEIDESQDWF